MKQDTKRSLRAVLAAISAVMLLVVVASWCCSYWRFGWLARTTNRYTADDLTVTSWHAVSARGEVLLNWGKVAHFGAMKYLREKDRKRTKPVWRCDLMKPKRAASWKLSGNSPLAWAGLAYVSRDVTESQVLDIDSVHGRTTRFGPTMHWMQQSRSRTLVLPHWLLALACGVMPVRWVYLWIGTRATCYRGFECFPPAPLITRAG